MTRLILLVLSAAGLLVGVRGDLLGTRGVVANPAATPKTRPPAPNLTRTGELLPTADWFEDIFRSLSGRGRKPARDPSFPLDEEGQEPRSEGGRFRTVCVRLCDGLPIPVSFATTRANFARDARRCAQTCPAGRLFVARYPGGEMGTRWGQDGGEMERMVDLNGQSYRQLPTAFLNQTTYVENCTCRGHPWDQDAIARHQAYAAQAAQRAAAPKPPAERRPPQRAQRRFSEPPRWAQSGSGSGE